MKIVARPIDTIVSFYIKGKPMPFRFRYEDEDGYHTVKIDKIISVDETKLAGIKAYVYLCQSNIDGQVKPYELKYIIEKCTWQLYKI